MKVLVTLCFLISCFVCSYEGYVCCAIDPCDDSLKNRNALRRVDSVYCYVCDLTVHKDSKHCPYCDKCVEKLDHHCKWLNTCIGAKNYRPFLAVLSGVCVLTSISLGLSLAFLIEAYAYTASFIDRIAVANEASIESIVHSDVLHLSLNGIRGILIVSVVLLAPLVGIIYQLAGFHTMLCKLSYRFTNLLALL